MAFDYGLSGQRIVYTHALHVIEFCGCFAFVVVNDDVNRRTGRLFHLDVTECQTCSVRLGAGMEADMVQAVFSGDERSFLFDRIEDEVLFLLVNRVYESLG